MLPPDSAFAAGDDAPIPQFSSRKELLAWTVRQELGRNVAIDERALQALEGPGRGHKYELWRNLGIHVPAIWRLYGSLGVNPLSARYSPSPLPVYSPWDRPTKDPQSEIGAVRSALRSPHKRNGPHQLTPAAIAAADNDRLTPMDLALSILQSQGPRNDPRRPNQILRELGRKSGLVRQFQPPQPSPEWTKLSERLGSLFAALCELDDSVGEQQFAIYTSGKQVRVLPFGALGAYQLTDMTAGDGSKLLVRANVVQPSGYFSQEAIAELEALISGDAPESRFQAFFEAHNEFLLALGPYSRIFPQLVLESDDGSRLVPDFFLEKIGTDFLDVCDLKLPTIELFRNQARRHRFRDAVMEGVAQLATYRDWFDDRDHRDHFKSRYSLQAFRPRVILVAGRRRSFLDDIARIRLESNLPGWVQLVTYDEVVDTARRYRQLSSPGLASTGYGDTT